jgi:hypothetical protein
LFRKDGDAMYYRSIDLMINLAIIAMNEMLIEGLISFKEAELVFYNIRTFTFLKTLKISRKSRFIFSECLSLNDICESKKLGFTIAVESASRISDESKAYIKNARQRKRSQ